MTLVVETIAGHAIQQAVGLHRVDVHELFALAMPHAALGALRLAAALSQRTIGLGLVLGHRCQVFANQDTGQHQHQHRLHHRPDDASDRHPGSAHDGQFTAAGKAAQTDQAADQGGHRQHVVKTPWRGQQNEIARIHQGIAVADVAHLVDEGKQRRQAQNDAEHGKNGQQHALADVTVELNHGPPPHDARHA
ncbi:hypothetical protein D3C81_676580 [compost metagenome]